MDKILESWFLAGCRTLEECRANTERNKESLASAAKARRSGKKEKEADTPKYTTFDAEDVLMSALARSYGEE